MHEELDSLMGEGKAFPFQQRCCFGHRHGLGRGPELGQASLCPEPTDGELWVSSCGQSDRRANGKLIEPGRDCLAELGAVDIV